MQFHGMIAGILNKFGKPGVIIGFCLGNIVLAYVSNGYTVELIHFKEILIASIGLLAIPKTVHINIEDFMQDGSGFLPDYPNRGLNRSKDAAEKLNNVSETIQEMAKTYKKDRINSSEIKNISNNKKIFVGELLDCLEPYKDNMLYDELSKTDSKLVDDIFNYLMDKQEIKKEALLDIFAQNNSYIVNSNDKEISEKLKNNINQAIRCINMAFKLSKTNFVWMKKIEEAKQNMEAQLNSVSKAISGIAKNIEDDVNSNSEYAKQQKEIIDKLNLKSIKIEEVAIKKQDRFFVELYLEKGQDEIDINEMEKCVSEVLNEKIVINEDACIGNKYSLISDDKYTMAIGISNKTKEGIKVSGDSYINTRLNDGKYLIALSDGMGSGEEARKNSKQALEMLKNLLTTGFDKNTSIELINTSLMNKNEEGFATLDIAIVDLYHGTVEMIKSGACPTYFKTNKKVQTIKSKSLPAGIVPDIKLDVFEKDIENKEIMLMCTDGILDSNVEYKNKELWVKYMLEDIETDNTKKIADLLLNEAIDNSFGIPKDDMSIFVCKFRDKQN